MNGKWLKLCLGLLIVALAACGGDDGQDGKVAQVTTGPTIQPSPVIVTATPRPKLPVATQQIDLSTQTPVPTAGGGLEGHGEDLFQDLPPTPAKTPEPPTPSVPLESLKEELFIAGGGVGGGDVCTAPPAGKALPAAELVGHFYHETVLCLWGFPVGQFVTVELYDPQTRLVATGELPVEDQVEGVSVVEVWLSFVGLPTGDWTVVASSPGAWLKDQFLVSEPKQPMLSAIPAAEMDVFGNEGWMACALNPYHAGEQVAMVGAGFPPGRSLPLGLYYLPGNNINSLMQLIMSLPVTADERGRFTAYLPVEPWQGAGSYYTIVPVDPGYEPNTVTADPLGAAACFQVVWGPGLNGAETILLSSGGGPLDDPRLQEAVLDAVNMDRAFEVVRSQQIAFLAQVGGQVVDAYANPYSPANAKYLMNYAGYPDGLGVLLAFPETDWMLADLAQVIAREIESAGFYAELMPLPGDRLEDFGREMRASGQPALWLTHR